MNKYIYGEGHGHIALDGISYNNSRKLHEKSSGLETVKTTLEQYRKENITFYRDGGDKWGISQKAKEIAPDYGIDFRSPLFAIYKKNYYGSILGKPFETIKDYKILVDEVKNNNGDFIKIMISGIMDFNEFGAISDYKITQNEITQMVDIAHESGFSVMAHVNGSTSAKMTLCSGVDSVEHGYYMDDECLEMLAKTKTVWLPTLAPVNNIMEGGIFDKNIVNRILDLQKKNIKKAILKNVSIALGSDAGSYMVEHVKGINQEEKLIKNILGYNEKTDKLLINGEQIISEKFKKH